MVRVEGSSDTEGFLRNVRSFTEAAEECIEDESISAPSVGFLLRQRFDKVRDPPCGLPFSWKLPGTNDVQPA